MAMFTYRKSHGNHQALWLMVAQYDVAMVAVYQIFDNCQAQTRAVVTVVIDAIERIPNQVFVGIVYAYAIVDDTDLYVLRQLADGHIDLAALGRVTHGIFNQVLQQGLKIQAAQCEFDVY